MWLPKGRLGGGRKYYLLYDKITPALLEAAFEKVRKNGGCGGVDGETIELFEQHREQTLKRISQEIRAGTYVPRPVKRVYIPKQDGRLRPLGIPSVRDRVVQEALNMLLSPVYEDTFQDCSYGFRKGRNAHQAIERIQKNLSEGYAHIVDADIERFFESIDHQLMMEFVLEELADRKLTRLVEAFMKSGVMDGTLIRSVAGTPQGGVISPLLANIYLNKFDREMQAKGHRIVRYADDFVVMCRTEEEARKAVLDIEAALARLKLRLNKKKTGIRDGRKGFTFLGFEIFSWGVRPTRRNIDGFKNKARLLTRRNRTRPIQEVIGRLNPVILGWGHYFKIGKEKVQKTFFWLDFFVRRRVRIYFYKRHRASSYYRLPDSSIAQMGLKSLVSILSGATLQESRMP